MRKRWVLAVAIGMIAGTPVQAAEPWVGRWAIDPATCVGFGGSTPATASLVVTDTSLWWFAGHCRIGKMYKLGHAAYIQARCGGEGSGDVPVSLVPSGADRMRVSWNRAKPEELRRCK